jgi:hypothetical protein
MINQRRHQNDAGVDIGLHDFYAICYEEDNVGNMLTVAHAYKMHGNKKIDRIYPNVSQRISRRPIMFQLVLT